MWSHIKKPSLIFQILFSTVFLFNLHTVNASSLTNNSPRHHFKLAYGYPDLPFIMYRSLWKAFCNCPKNGESLVTVFYGPYLVSYDNYLNPNHSIGLLFHFSYGVINYKQFRENNSYHNPEIGIAINYKYHSLKGQIDEPRDVYSGFSFGYGYSPFFTKIYRRSYIDNMYFQIIAFGQRWVYKNNFSFFMELGIGWSGIIRVC